MKKLTYGEKGLVLYIFCIFMFREAFKTSDRDKDGFISMKELKKEDNMLGTMLTKEELVEVMAEADSVCRKLKKKKLISINTLVCRMGMEY